MAKAFVDTNILVYAADAGSSAPDKKRIARELLRTRDLHLSAQVLNEFVANARHPKKLGFDPHQETEWLKRLLLFPIGDLTPDTFVSALQIHTRYQLSHWDSLIIASAKQQLCQIIYTEDLNHGQVYHGVQAQNPFR